MNKKAFFSDALGFGLASFLTKGVALLVVPVLTRNLSPSSFGALELLVGLSGIATVLVSMSFESYIAREWGVLKFELAKSKVFSTLIYLVGAVAIGFIFVTWILADGLANVLFENDELRQPLFLSMLSGSLAAILGLPLMVLRMERRLARYLIVIGLQSAAYLGLIFFLLAETNINVETVVIATLASVALAFLVASYYVKNYFSICFDTEFLKPAFRYSLPLLPAVGVTWINAQVDKYALLYFYDTKTVGEFAVVTKVTAIVTIAVMVFRQAWLPYSFSIARRDDQGQEYFKKVLNTYFGVGLVVCLILVICSSQIFAFLAPADYQITLEILPILLLASLVYGSASIVNIGIMVSGKTEWNSYAAMLGGISNIALTVLLVPIFGVKGAAWGTLIASLIFSVTLGLRTSMIMMMKWGWAPIVFSGLFLGISMSLYGV